MLANSGMLSQSFEHAGSHATAHEQFSYNCGLEGFRKDITDWPGRSGLAGVIKHVLEYLRHVLNNENLDSCKVGVHRSALSEYHIYADDKSDGQHPLLCSLRSRIFNFRPP